MNTPSITTIRWTMLYALLVPAFVFAQPISLSPDVTIELAGETVTDEDVASDGTDLFLSFNTTVMLSGETFDDADLVQVTPTGFVRYFDRALAGVPAAMDLDAADVDADSVVYVSFDTGGTLGNVGFADLAIQKEMFFGPPGPSSEAP